MKENNIVLDKTYDFALRIINLYKHLYKGKKEFVLSRKVVRSGTSIGAHAEEAIGAQSRRDFKSKLSISYKDARETHYWLRLLRDAGYIDSNESHIHIEECEELLKIIGSILKTIKKPDS